MCGVEATQHVHSAPLCVGVRVSNETPLRPSPMPSVLDVKVTHSYARAQSRAHQDKIYARAHEHVRIKTTFAHVFSGHAAS